MSFLEKLFARKNIRISRAQNFQLDLIKRTNFNSCDGVKIARLLRKNHEIWRAAFMPLDSFSLRDLEKDIWHADILYVYVKDGCQNALEELARAQFDADEISWVGGQEAVEMLGTTEVAEKSQVVLSVWWD